MKAKEYFRQISRIETMIKSKMRRAELFREIASSVSSPKYSDMPRPPQRKSTSLMEDAINKAIDLEKEIKEDERKLNELKIEALELIGKIENNNSQTVLILRYFEKKSWEEIKDLIYYSLSGVYKLHGNALNEIDKLINKV